ncbi:MAG: hypothetical protein AVDCRST_MAG38-3000 [uncultured Solirubrobacteraceae bacterium]|uniref:Uncharacterized protein n=1 Tax=uncultured Solirubrobacteraceae bacterium TaxID=1162706 RepID=A0A6J4SMP0_9ACTN|nr:MAG: hypothetical protein AVDCRST_MAG38-3000 [uncultured Solirubrobacteraceae bacterium]
MQGPSEEHRREERETTGRDRARAADAAAPDGSRLFPYNSVVGIIDDEARLEAALQALLAAGFAEAEVRVLAGEAGVRQIDAKGERKGLLARLFRMVDAMGEEREHTARHVAALEAGHFVVTVETPDDVSKARARDALAAHGGHFISYYSRWATEDLAP